MNTKYLRLQLFAQEGEGAEVPVQENGAAAAQPETQAASAPQADREAALHRHFQSHFRELERQSEEMKRNFPDFDLRRELRDPVFYRLTSPAVGLGVEDAYYTVHRRELHSAAMQAAQRQVTSAIASGARRPQENGISGQAPAVSSFDYRSASREQREELKRRIRLAAAEGRKLYPNG